jgi:thiol-disulfide isomerase/thioredoxin
MQSFLLIAVFAFSVVALQAQNTITGRLPNYTNRDVLVYQYDDHISQKRSVAGTAHTDQHGYFSVRVANANQLLHVEAGNKAIDFYVLKKGEYLVEQERDNQLKLTERNAMPINQTLRSMNDWLTKHWYPLFIDVTKQEFKTDVHPDTVLRTWENCRAKYTAGIHNKVVLSWLHYKLAGAKCSYLQIVYRRIGEQRARQWMNDFEEEYFNSRPVDYTNPFYISTFQGYMQSRILMIPFRRGTVNDDRDQWNLIKTECSFLKGHLQQLAMVNGIVELYKNKFYGKDKTADEKQIRGYEDAITDPSILEIYRNVITVYNTVKPGDAFPVLTLQNESNRPVSIDSINSDVILIDFWATWCSPCREHMQDFPALMKKYGGKLMIVSISVDDSLQTMKAFLDKNKYTGQWMTLFNGRNGNYYNKIRIDGYPTYYILNKERKIIAIPFFSDMETELEKQLAN